jgi:hypothetical protein
MDNKHTKMNLHKKIIIIALLTLILFSFVFCVSFLRFYGRINTPTVFGAIISFIYAWYLQRLLKTRKFFIIVVFFFAVNITYIGSEIFYRILIDIKIIFYKIDINSALLLSDRTEEQRRLIDRYFNNNSYSFVWIVSPLMALGYCGIILISNFLIKFIFKIFGLSNTT